MKKLICIIIAIALTGTLASGAFAAAATFPDISNPETAKDVAVLQLLGIIEGTGGRFNPSGKLTRAEFCAMAVKALGRGDEEAYYRNRTIFPDVKSTHWARGYINFAVNIDVASSEMPGGDASGDKAQGNAKLISGNANGLFMPDKNITYGEAATLLARMLGYSDIDAGMLWPTGYTDLAGRIGLAGGLSLRAGDEITRAQSARLFCSLLTVPQKGGTDFASTFGTLTKDVMMMDLDVSAPDGSSGAAKTSAGVYKPKNGAVPDVFLGLTGSVVIDDKGFLRTFIPSGGKSVKLLASSANAGQLTANDGKTYEIPQKTIAYTATETTTFEKVFIDIARGTPVTIFYSDSGTVKAVYISTQPPGEAMIVPVDGPGTSEFSPLTGGRKDFTLYKNDAEAELADIAKYDTAIYDSAANAVFVSDLRITGFLEDAKPNLQYPKTLTIMKHDFEVLPSAYASLSGFRLGESATLLLTSDFRVAGVVRQAEASGNAVGIVTACAEKEATVTLLGGIELKGDPRLSAEAAALKNGELVRVGSNGLGQIALYNLRGSGARGDFKKFAMTLGGKAVSKSVAIYERVDTGAVARIKIEDIAQDNIRSEKVIYTGVGVSGKVNMIVLDDVTGDRYTYGFIKTGREPVGSLGGEDEPIIYNRTISVTNSDGPGKFTVTGLDINNVSIGGIVLNTSADRAIAFAPLQKADNIGRSSFSVSDGKTWLTVGLQKFRVSDTVQCYNKQNGSWFKTLSDIRAFSDDMTVYYDKEPAEGGKIRMVVAN